MAGVEWVTPKPIIYLARMVMGDIDLDPASSDWAQRNVEARSYYTPEQDGLKRPWFGRVWLSPPNGRRGFPDFTGKLVDEFCAGRVTEAIALVPNSTDTAWHHRLSGLRMPVCYKLGRVRFESPDRKSSTPANGQSFFYLGDRPERFAEVFRPVGFIRRNIAEHPRDREQAAGDRARAEASRPTRMAA